MKKLLTLFGIWLGFTLAIFLAISFTYWQINPALWGEGARFMLALMSTVIMVPLVSYLIDV